MAMVSQDRVVDDEVLHGDLVRWIARNGGVVHPNLALHTPEPVVAAPSSSPSADPASGRFSRRGIFARGGVSEGEVLIRLPPTLALDGMRLPTTYEVPPLPETVDSSGRSTGQQRRNASPWLRCLASFIRARLLSDAADSSRCFHDPYLASLPGEYDSLLDWSEGEIRSFLAGTALGAAASREGRESALEDRFRRTVLPYMVHLTSQGIFPQDEGAKDQSEGGDATIQKNPKRPRVETLAPDGGNVLEAPNERRLYPLFREGCMCISTRAFHMQSADGAEPNANESGAEDCYKGPYLLPYIDLLNHAPKGSRKHVTTLRRDADGSFLMIAERDVAVGEEVCHSYDSGSGGPSDSSLNSAQLLQTFGFVDVDGAARILVEYYQQNGKHRLKSESNYSLGNMTPAVLTMKEISQSCKKIANSPHPNKLRKFMDHSGLLDEGWEHWPLPDLENPGTRQEILASFPEELVIPFGGSLPDTLLTACCLHFLPDGAIEELLADSSKEDGGKHRQAQCLLFGMEVLDDYYLGMLVIQSLLSVVEAKMSTYKVSSSNLIGRTGQIDQARQLLESIQVMNPDTECRDDTSFGWGEKEIDDVKVLSRCTSLREGVARSFPNLLEKFRYGMIISLEERACLVELKKTILDRLSQLSGEEI